jgi:asparagine synthase (glutamine-hydrolysing)
MQAQSSAPVRTFTAAFRDPAYDESRYARAVAAHLGTTHTEFLVDPSHALEIVPRLADLYDEPFADSSQLPTQWIAAVTRRHVTVCLSGDGGDELFAGYDRYFWVDWLWRGIGWLPERARKVLATGLEAVPGRAYDALGRLLPARVRTRFLGEKVARFARVLSVASPDEANQRLVSHWEDPQRLVPGAREFGGIRFGVPLPELVPRLVERMQFLDLVTYLPDDLLVKLDRAAMAVGLEPRVPLLDRRVVEFVWRLPFDLKVRRGERKWLLRRVLERYVPRRLTDRPKMGFGVPLDAWLRGPLREWAEELLSPNRLSADGLLDPEPIRRRWAQHLVGRANWGYPLWTVLVFQAWRLRWL